MDIDKRLKNIFKTYFEINFDRYTGENLDKELLGDTFNFAARDLLYLFFDVEKEFDITIPQEDIVAGKVNTLNNIAEIIINQLQKKEKEAV
ncbi:peptide maturation system acyl carrier-related protein [Candidatus Micrarchaeota archaeon]|jgi:peptide maturation system acyl carrier-related protein|nr:peptide maturation system acyl carrier-related protein [Candidatus Micrarchaeota archaeon]